MKTEQARINLRSVMDLVADGHLSIMNHAAGANERLIRMDSRAEKFPDGKLAVSKRHCEKGLAILEMSLACQRSRLQRAIDEVETIRKNISTI